MAEEEGEVFCAGNATVKQTHQRSSASLSKFPPLPPPDRLTFVHPQIASGWNNETWGHTELSQPNPADLG